jgi:hypothetical protein
MLTGLKPRQLSKEFNTTGSPSDVILHLDFEGVDERIVPVSAEGPNVECTGVADCVGVKLGGALRPGDSECEGEVPA